MEMEMEITSVNPRKCPYCPKHLKSQRYYDDHVRIHTGEKPFKCHRCSYASTQSANLGQHLRKFGNCEPLQCPICSEFSSCSPKGLHLHVEEMHKKKESDADNTEDLPLEEEQTFTLDPNDIPNSDLYFTEVEHVEIFGNGEDEFQELEEELPEPVEPEKFEREGSPDIIIESVYSVNEEPTNGKLFHCPHCHYNTYDSADLASHIRAKKEWTFQCQDCEFSCCTSQGIISHRDEAHRDGQFNEETGMESYEAKEEFDDEDEEPPQDPGQEQEIFRCHNCCYTATTEWTLIRHQRQTDGDPFKCSLCEYTSCSEYVLKRHEKLCNGITPDVPKSLPKDQSQDQKDVSTAAGSTSGSKINKWRVGKYRPRKPAFSWHQQHSSLQQHRKYQFKKQSGGHVCPYCSKIFRKNHLVDHLRIHTGDRPFKCDRCSFASAQPSSLTQHKSRKENHDPPLQCTECEFTSCNSVFLRKHVTECHSNTLTVPQQLESAQDNLPTELVTGLGLPKVKSKLTDSSARHSCPYCTYSSLNRSKLNRHVAIHFDNKPYKCQYCPYRCRNSTDIKTHERTHTGERPYKCTKCPAAFAQAGAFAKHRRSHLESGEHEPVKQKNLVPQIQPQTPFIFQNGSLNNVTVEHFLIATPIIQEQAPMAIQSQFHQVSSQAMSNVETYFKCEYCSYQSKSKPDVVRHLRIHTGEKPYQCSLCPFKSARSYDVKRHALTRHYRSS